MLWRGVFASMTRVEPEIQVIWIFIGTRTISTVGSRVTVFVSVAFPLALRSRGRPSAILSPAVGGPPKLTPFTTVAVVVLIDATAVGLESDAVSAGPQVAPVSSVTK